ncbi:MAG: D-glycerate dehydrogenase [Planctomycetes bacterium]|nr:D-glycerate dehydrogenase [Planctomycetota bacterium]MBI3845461.1 D-glycerate dehydrogenase [Planctomycetota bacterium]
MPKIVVTRVLPDEVILELSEKARVEVHADPLPPSREALLDLVRDADGIISLLTDRIDREMLDAAPKLRVVSNYAVGVDNVDVAEATRRRIAVTNTPDVLTESTADLAFALALAAARRLVEAEKFARRGAFQGWHPLLFLGHDVFGKTLGVVGLGRIGKAVARRGALGFGMRVLYAQPRRDEAFERDVPCARVGLDVLLRESDVVSLHVPLTPATRHLIGESELRSMKKTSVLVNTSRGPVIDEASLVRALEERWIFAAGLDVFEREPEIPEVLRQRPDVVILPHIGSATIETRTRMARMAAENALAVLGGRRPPSIVNPEVL